MSARSALLLLCIFLTGAAYTDLRCRKVYNRWIFIGFFLETILLGLKFLLPAALILFPVYLLFRLGLMGAGDGKVIMLICGTLGLYHAFWAISLGFCLAAVWSSAVIFHERSLRARLYRLGALAGQIFFGGGIPERDGASFSSKQDSVPLAASLAAGTILYILCGHYLLKGGLL